MEADQKNRFFHLKKMWAGEVIWWELSHEMLVGKGMTHFLNPQISERKTCFSVAARVKLTP